MHVSVERDQLKSRGKERKERHGKKECWWFTVIKYVHTRARRGCARAEIMRTIPPSEKRSQERAKKEIRKGAKETREATTRDVTDEEERNKRNEERVICIKIAACELPYGRNTRCWHHQRR